MRSFLTEFASTKGFDPLKAENWNAISLNQIAVAQVGIFKFSFSVVCGVPASLSSVSLSATIGNRASI